MQFSLTFYWIFIQLLISISSINSAKILFFHHLSSSSHRIATWPLAEALEKRGHEISYFTPFPNRNINPNITEYSSVSHSTYVHAFLNQEFDIGLRVRKEMAPLLNGIFEFAYTACEILYSSEEFQDFLYKNPKFDLLIIDNCFFECGIGLAQKLSSKYIVFNTIPILAFEHDALGYQPESSVIPELEVDPPSSPMNFFTRLSNTLMSIRWHIAHSLYSAKIDNLIRNKLKLQTMPFIGELVSKVNLVFYTGDVITDYPRAFPPNFVNIAGIHCKESTQSLPEEMEKFITGSNETESDGFVYISLGSLVDSSNLPDNIKNVFFEAIKSFPNVKFLWKWAGDFAKNAPENIFMAKWFPQIEVMGHPKIRGFISQSGRPSTLEALFNGVPIISFPILGDQDHTANRLAQIGAAIKLEIGKVTVDNLKDAISKTVYDSSVKTRMTKYQKAFRDRPINPLDTAVWWTEYVLRTEDTLHLRPAGVDQSWFVRRQIDVWAFLSITFFVIIMAGFVIIIKISKMICKAQLNESKLKLI